MMELRTSEKGLSNEGAEKRFAEFGPTEVSAQKPTPAIIFFLSAFKDPFVSVLALLMVVSTLPKDFEAAIVMGVMILASV
ncbi:cation-transporting P-type ATPase, partial [Enterococcus faecalis]|uniref:cation-transporting P-type ATPase n=1 Tax=Enterococcus faecalis TaxID=1351 RepID=UPI003D6C24EB